MKDFLGNELKVGDQVIFVRPNYRNFAKGVIYHITEKTVFINWNNPHFQFSSEDTLKQHGYQVIKVAETI